MRPVIRVAVGPFVTRLPNGALLTDAFSSLRWACGAAKRGR